MLVLTHKNVSQFSVCQFWRELNNHLGTMEHQSYLITVFATLQKSYMFDTLFRNTQLDSLLLCFWLKRSQYVLHQAFLKEHKQKVVTIICTQFHYSGVKNLSHSHLSHSSKKSRKGLIFCRLYIQLTFYFVSLNQC